MEIYGVNLRIQSGYRKIRTRNHSVFGFEDNSSNIRLNNLYNHMVDCNQNYTVNGVNL